MTTTDTIAIAAHRHDMANDALAEIGDVARALLHLIESLDTTRSVTRLSRGMLTRVKALSNIAAECIEADADERRLDTVIRVELTGTWGPAGSVAPAAVPRDDDRQLQGGIAYFELLRELAAVPDYLLPGKSLDEANSTARGLHVAQDLVVAAALRCGLQVTDPGLVAGFMGCLARSLIGGVNGSSIGLGDNPESDARAALSEVAAAEQGTSLEEASHD